MAPHERGLTAGHIADVPQLDPPGRELQHAVRRAIDRLEEERRVVAERRRSALIQVPDALFGGGVVVPFGFRVDVDLLVPGVPVAERDPGVAGEVLRFECLSRRDPAGGALPDGMDDARTQAPLAVLGGHGAPDDAADPAVELLGDFVKRRDIHALLLRGVAW
ncbi:MAG: hypothetical protein Kow0010_24610 [Dehalococcoidia bacterium]